MSLRPRTVLKSILLLVAAAIVLSIVAVAWLKLAPRRVPSGQPPLTTLSAGSLPAFRASFHATDGDTRILMLLSPT